MARIWGALGQVVPAATTLTDAYTAPAGKHSTIEVVICNRAGAATVRLSHAVNGAADTAVQYLLYDFALAAGDSKATARFAVRAGDVVRAYSSTGTVTFNVNGIEEDD